MLTTILTWRLRKRMPSTLPHPHSAMFILSMSFRICRFGGIPIRIILATSNLPGALAVTAGE